MKALAPAVALLMMALSGCSDDTTDDGHDHHEQMVAIHGSTFSPATIPVEPGTEVRWMNHDGFAHTATADDGSFDTGNIAAGSQSSGIDFHESGSFPYHCSIHPSMKGTIVVAG